MFSLKGKDKKTKNCTETETYLVFNFCVHMLTLPIVN